LRGEIIESQCEKYFYVWAETLYFRADSFLARIAA
jgi:hypothetical protein